MVNDVSVVHLLLLYLDDISGATIADEVKGDAVTTNEANADEDRMRLRRVDIARRVVALRLIDSIISFFFVLVYGLGLLTQESLPLPTL